MCSFTRILRQNILYTFIISRHVVLTQTLYLAILMKSRQVFDPCPRLRKPYEGVQAYADLYAWCRTPTFSEILSFLPSSQGWLEV